jgi:hypothetical protein
MLCPAVAALAHFCDNHGPKIVLCTRVQQLARTPPPPPSTVKPWATASSPPRPSPFPTTRGHSSEKNKKKKRRKTCETCRSFQDDVRYLISDDKCSGNSFLSSSVTALAATNPALERRLKMAASRSLSVEESAVSGDGRTREIMFSDDGFVYSRSFKLVDLSHRGGKRTYCVAVLVDDRSRLVSNASSIGREAEALIGELELLAAESSSSPQTSPLVLCDDGRKLVIPPQKNLREITCEDVYQRIHYSFIKMLSLFSKPTDESVEHRQKPISRTVPFKTLASMLKSDDLLTLVSGLLSGACVDFSSSSESVLEGVCQTLDDILPGGYAKTCSESQVTYFGGRQGSSAKISVTINDQGSGGQKCALKGMRLIYADATVLPSSLSRRVALYLQSDCGDEFILSGITTAVEEYEAFARAFVACKKSVSAKHFCRKIGLTGKDENVVKFFAQFV